MEECGLGYTSLTEINSTVHWYKSWDSRQKEKFMQDLVSKAVPHKAELLLDALGSLTMGEGARPPSIFECQLRLFGKWFNKWTLAERNYLVERLEELDPAFVEQFYCSVRQTASLL